MKTMIVVILLLTGCAYTPEVTLLCGSKKLQWNGDDIDAACSVTVAQRFGQRGICAATHGSNPSKEDDPTFEFVGCGTRWGGQRR